MNTKLRFCFVLLSLALLASCNSDDDPTPGFVPGGTLSATIDGMSWASTSMSLNRPVSTTLQISSERNSSAGIQASGIGITLSGYVGVYTYIIDTSTRAYYAKQANHIYTSTSGQIVVSRDDDSFLKASFNFDAKDSLNENKTITGTFTYRRK